MKYLLISILLLSSCAFNKTMTKKEKVVDRALETVFFELDSTELTDESKQRIAENAEVMSKKPDFVFTIKGHADPIGEKSYNNQLALERAMKVKAELINNGVSPKQLKVKSYGELKPIVNTTIIGKTYLNRRVEFEPDKKLQITKRVKKLRKAAF